MHQQFSAPTFLLYAPHYVLLMQHYSSSFSYFSCFIRGDLLDIAVSVGTVGVPTTLIFIFNVVTFICSCFVIIKFKIQHNKRDTGQNHLKLMSPKEVGKLLVSLTGFMCLLGIPAAIITIVDIAIDISFVRWLRIIYYSMQGFFIFIFFTIAKPDLRNQWKEFLHTRCMTKMKHGTPVNQTGVEEC